MSLVTIAMYHFVRLENLSEFREELKKKCQELEFKGTILLAPEGINCFLSGHPENIAQFKAYLADKLQIQTLTYKENPCLKHPFNRMLVKLKKEIISMGNPEIKPDEFTAPYLPPAQLKNWLDEEKEFILLDTRNNYEVSVGTFEKAIHLDVNSFRDFAQASQEIPNELKEKPIVMFCTGGIRCEKASALFLKTGFKEVYQLEGGILKYFEECQDAHYKGDCFVFDWRLAVDSQLMPAPRSQQDPNGSGRHQVQKTSKENT